VEDSELRMVFVVRKDLKMPKGKVAAQCAHAMQLLLFREAVTTENVITLKPDPAMTQWINGSYTKIVVAALSEEQLQDVMVKAEFAGWRPVLVRDEGRTCFDGQPTQTVVAFGPVTAEQSREITGHLSLLQ
jgi:peptidyl-tRNA hydrolase, PTH2 family